MKTTTKGNLLEIEVKKILEGEGWSVFRQHRKPIYMAGRIITIGADAFGCDMIAKKQGEKTRWIQVSTRANKSAKIKQVLLFPWNYQFESLELWLRFDGKRIFEIFQAPDFNSIGLKECLKS